MHEEAAASADLTSGSGNGPSGIKYHGSRTPNENVGYLMNEAFLTGASNTTHVSNFDQPDPFGAPAGGPSDGSKAGNYNFMRPLAAPAPAYWWTLSEELMFVGKGFQQDAGGGDTENDHLYYLELPILVNYNTKLSNGHEFRIGAGPYAAMGLFGHYSSSFQGMTASGSLSFGSNKDYTMMDYGAVINVGYQVCSKVDLSLNYDLGFRNINGTEDKAYNRSFGLNIGYRIK